MASMIMPSRWRSCRWCSCTAGWGDGVLQQQRLPRGQVGGRPVPVNALVGGHPVFGDLVQDQFDVFPRHVIRVDEHREPAVAGHRITASSPAAGAFSFSITGLPEKCNEVCDSAKQEAAFFHGSHLLYSISNWQQPLPRSQWRTGRARQSTLGEPHTPEWTTLLPTNMRQS